MIKAIVMSFQSTPAFNIMALLKDLELRTRVPKDHVGWIYGYVTKAKPRLAKFPKGYMLNQLCKLGTTLNGTIPFRFWFDEYDTYTDESGCSNNENGYECENEYMYQLCELKNELKKLCLTCDEVEKYGNGKDLYALHIKKLEIFDKPMELGEFYKGFGTWEECDVGYKWVMNGKVIGILPLTKAPQSYQYVYVNEVEE